MPAADTQAEGKSWEIRVKFVCSALCLAGGAAALFFGFLGANDRSEFATGVCSIKQGRLMRVCFAADDNGNCNEYGWSIALCGAVFSAEGYQVRAHSWLRLQPQLRELLPPLQKCKAFIVARAVVLYVLSAARKCERMAAGI